MVHVHITLVGVMRLKQASRCMTNMTNMVRGVCKNAQSSMTSFLDSCVKRGRREDSRELCSDISLMTKQGSYVKHYGHIYIIVKVVC